MELNTSFFHTKEAGRISSLCIHSSKGIIMNITQTTSGSADSQVLAETNDPLNLPLNPSQAAPQQAQNGSPLSFENGPAQTPNPISMGMLPNPNQMVPQAAQAQQPLQQQGLSGGLIGSIEQMLQEFLAKLQSLLKMVSGTNDGVPQAQAPAAAAPASSGSAPSINLAVPDASGSQSTSQTPQVRMASVPQNESTAKTGDTSLNTSDPNLQKLVDKYGPDYVEASKETGVPAKLLASVTMQESGGDVNAKSTNPGNGKTDSGMNQINPDTYAAVRGEHPDKLGANMNDPKNQIMCTALLLQHGKEKFGTYDAALRSYNSGDNQVDKNNLSNVTIGDPNYVNEVNGWMSKFK